MQRIKPQMIVTNLEGDRRGVTVPDLTGMLSCCLPEETPVVWEGESSFIGTDTDQLKIIGPENAKADAHKCGAGRGAECCIWLVVNGDGFQCERHSDLRYMLIFKSDMISKREPSESYPSCQKF